MSIPFLNKRWFYAEDTNGMCDWMFDFKGYVGYGTTENLNSTEEAFPCDREEGEKLAAHLNKTGYIP